MPAFVVIDGGREGPLREGNRSFYVSELSKWPCIAGYISAACASHSEDRPYLPGIQQEYLAILTGILASALLQRGFTDAVLDQSVIRQRWHTERLFVYPQDAEVFSVDRDVLRLALLEAGAHREEGVIRTLVGTFTVAWISAANATPPNQRRSS